MSRFLVISSKAFSGIISIKKKERSNLEQLQLLSSLRKATKSAEALRSLMVSEQAGHHGPPASDSQVPAEPQGMGRGVPREPAHWGEH